MKIGQRIKDLRKQRKLTQKKAAELMEITAAFLCDIEHDRTKPSLMGLISIARALNTTVSYLVGEDSNSDIIHPNHLNTLHTLSSSEDGQQILQVLSCFDDWTELDRQELIQYLAAKEIVRNIGR